MDWDIEKALSILFLVSGTIANVLDIITKAKGKKKNKPKHRKRRKR